MRIDGVAERHSARRIAIASDQRRRRLERAMHDGVQQHLALLALKISLLRGQIRRDPDAAEAMCAELSESLANAQRELRELAYRVYPAVLENEGLVAALDDVASRMELAVDIQAAGVDRHGPEVETAIYFCCLEALENVERYAPGVPATVSLSQADGFLDFVVSDAGPGFDPEVIGGPGGLQHVADRLAAMGGSLEVSSGPGGGATVRGSVPFEPPVPAQSRRSPR